MFLEIVGGIIVAYLLIILWPLVSFTNSGRSTRPGIAIDEESELKIVLSRKGFDSAAGGIASPIMPDGRMISMPIPSSADQFTFADVNAPDIDLAHILADLSRSRHVIGDHVHLDPDLDRPPASRLPGWRPALGQTGAAQTHLEKNGVGKGDIFLFFGWFRHVEKNHEAWRYVPNAPDLHVMFGWLEVGDILHVGLERDASIAAFPWIANHPHVAQPEVYLDRNNTLYMASERSSITPDARCGGGRFTRYEEALRLTASGMSRSKWSLPAWFHPGTRPALSYHSSLERWASHGDRVLLSTVGRGQEFVIDGKHYPELADWTSSLIREQSQGIRS